MSLSNERDAIRNVILRYFTATDARDGEGVAACFTDDAHLEFFNGATVIDGIDAVRTFFAFEGSKGLPGNPSVVGSTHLCSIGEIVIDGVHARANTSAVAYLLSETDDTTVLITRGLRYEDELYMAADGWQIRRRRHLPDWETRTAATAKP